MRTLIIMLLCLCIGYNAGAQTMEATIDARLQAFFSNYTTVNATIGNCKLERTEIDHQKKRLTIYANKNFGYQPFTEENVAAIYRSVKQILPGPTNYYKLCIVTDGKAIEDLIPVAIQKGSRDRSRTWHPHVDYKGNPWISNLSRPYEISKGLENRHLAVWQSHGRYFSNKKNEWIWQRPRLFCTTEDLFTQSIVVPYLIPMLENAGAVVFTPRERDWQRNEVIVDNNSRGGRSIYLEENYRKNHWQEIKDKGFAQRYATYPDGHNPFKDGTARYISTIRKKDKAFAQWIPDIPETGKYAVYVSYVTLPNSVSDAKYLVFHKGGVTEFSVNQKMGEGTWVYLGSFEFDKGVNDYGMIALSNESSENGVVTADAVRFGGGMGNITRGGTTSGMPRFLEGARYWGQWAGMPYEVYSKSLGQNDYNDDINARSLMVNYLNGGSVYNPNEKGLNVPMEMTLGIHSDAGFSKEDELVGSLGIYTTDFNNGKLNAGMSRYASRDLADLILTGLQKDLSMACNVTWKRRSMWNRNYSETRLPSVPSAILELLAHQNFGDMRLGLDPNFQFQTGRSIYKSILKYNATLHNKDYVVQPLPVSHFAIQLGEKKNSFHLSWEPVADRTEPSAKPDGYIVYTRIGRGGFDNGVYVKDTEYTFEAETGIVYSFKVTAVNKGGESFPSETLSAYKAKRSKGTLLIVNAFDRLSGPASICDTEFGGFDLANDPGVSYIKTPVYCGYQQGFARSGAGIETEGGWGYSGNELEGMLIAGNTFDYPFIHGKAIQMAGNYSFVSCSDEAVEKRTVNLSDYPVVDLIYGAELKGMSPAMQRLLADYCQRNGNLFISGAYIGRSMNSPAALQFTSDILKYSYGGSIPIAEKNKVYGLNQQMTLPGRMNEQVYAIPNPDCLVPAAPAYSVFAYQNGNTSAGIAYSGKYKTFVMGFPLECVESEHQRSRIMKAALDFFEK